MATFTPAVIATRYQTDAKTLRRFLRASAASGLLADKGYKAPGKGARWAIEGRDLNALRGAFNGWLRDQEAAKAAREAAAQAAAQAAEAASDEILEDEILEDSEPTED